MQSGQTDGLRARANACGKLSGNGVDFVSQTRKRKACYGELRCSRSDAGKREEGKRREMEMKEGRKIVGEGERKEEKRK